MKALACVYKTYGGYVPVCMGAHACSCWSWFLQPHGPCLAIVSAVEGEGLLTAVSLLDCHSFLCTVPLFHLPHPLEAVRVMTEASELWFL